ncbi:hypothetical protein TSUD_274060 [Trifolium subterraneum]|uniref:DNA polymerase epsilon catalytic subunit n=1 Tax=Trifolium subterraneum TaxID=3900 RepID=A0A2Z6N784_TRISU|nr:hypothetical protein TSUD_274060 [Trifolium subterraneum]
MNSDGRKWDRKDNRISKKQKLINTAEEELEAKLGFDIFSEGEKRLGWLLTFSSSSYEDEDTRKAYSCVDLYFVTQDGSSFKTKYRFRPYFYVATKNKMEMDVDAYLRRRYESQIADIKIVEKEDLDLKNHLSGLRKSYLKLSFDTVQQLMNVRNDLMHVVERNKAKSDAAEAYESILTGRREQKLQDFLDCIIDLREYDVPYHVRFAIDNDIRCGLWYDVVVSNDGVTLERRTDLLQRAEVRVCAFDIETTKLPLKFPDADYDSIMMISYMCVGDDIEDLEFTPKPEFEGCFKVTNVQNEIELLRLWFSHMQEVKPGIYVTYNGDFFDWPFLERRAAHHGFKMSDELGFQCDMNQGECRAKFAPHLDCFAWVKRDSYLPQGSQGLKAVTKAKLGYDPEEVNPEDMVRFAKEKPQMMASYSVSDAVSTYYLYTTYVHPFIFSLATIIPMSPDEVLRKGSGTLCEMLLMVQSYKANVICPNKHQSDAEKFYKNHLLESETYIGGHVECLESGVFRSDIPCSFTLEPSAFEQLINNLDRDLQYAIRVEGKMDLDSVSNYDEVKNSILEKPPSIVTDEICTACDFNRPGKTCLRKLEWVWRGSTFTAKKRHINGYLTSQLPNSVKLESACAKIHFTLTLFAGFVLSGSSFRDRRYEYKGLNKVWKGKLSEAKASGNSMKIQEAQDMVVLYDSLQLAHKCILNSFYGYVMRKGARWYSMEMAGVVTYTGAKIIQNARLLVEKIGKPLELDTDGIWCALPGSFPENFTFKTIDSKRKLTISYPCVMLNVDVAINNTNDQYQTLTDPNRKTYTTHSECSIEFEVDGPYKAMIIPASKEEGILIKKRYAVFNDDGSLAELKGFEIKRRGELKLIKVFQAELFENFLHGSTLKECYSEVAFVANRWLDLLDNQGQDIADSELLDYISESSTMSKSLADYGQQKSCAVTTAKRLADFLGDTMVKDKGLRCQYIVASEPKGTPVSERAVPVAIFQTDAEVMKFYVRKWCKVSSDVGIRSIIDWSYYKQRLGSAIQKIITIPAAMQKVANPVPRVVHPDWLHKKVREKEDKFRQRKIDDTFKSMNKNESSKKNNDSNGMEDEIVNDMEDFGNRGRNSTSGPRPIIRHYKANNEQHSEKFNGHEDSEQQHIGSSNINQSLSLSQQDEICENVDRIVDYQGWLQIKKRKWKSILGKRKKQRLENSKRSDHLNGSLEQTNGKMNHGKTNVSSYFRRQEVVLTRCHWQIIQLVQSSQVGQFFAWVVVDGIMLKIPISVPRVFYLNSRSQNEEFSCKRVNKTLPHGRHSYNLYEGIYETKVPLDFNAIVQLGCVCKVDKTAKKRSLQEPWNLSELHMKTTTECAYLEQSISFFYLYHSISEGRAIYVGYFPGSQAITFVVVNPYQNKDLSPIFLERQFRDACRALSIEPPLRNDINFKVEYVALVKDAETVMQSAINDHRSEHHGPMVAVIECPDVQLLKLGIRALDDFPCLTIPSNARDSQYQILGWQQVAAKLGMQRCAASVQWLNERIALSRYAHVPLGNFEFDWLMFTVDTFFSRALRDNQQVLWISDDGFPDLGGNNGEENCFLDEVHQSVCTFPGAYRKITVEIKIHHLAVDALLKCNQVNEMEGGALLGLDHEFDSEAFPVNGQNGFDESTSCKHAFRVLKHLIQRCLSDAVTSGNVFADAILQHLYRWLCRDLFEWIELEQLQFWCSLLFMDQYNYGGIPAKSDEAMDDESQVDIISSWNIAEYLPKKIQDHYVFIVSQFMYIPWNYARKQAAIRASVLSGDSCTPSINIGAAEAFESEITEYIKEQISSYFTDKLLGVVRDIVLHMKGMGRSENDPSTSSGLPQLADDLHRGDAALEFIKHVCAVLALDQSVQHDVHVMRKNLLKYVRVREFAPEAEFHDPCHSFTLPNVICSYCNDCRDLDLCRDPTLLTEEWHCAVPQCGQPYDREVMENALLQIARQRERQYHLQDLVCVRCNQVKAAHLAEQCACAGSFKCKEDATEFRKKMLVIFNIASRQKFQLLQECTSWMSELNI